MRGNYQWHKFRDCGCDNSPVLFRVTILDIFLEQETSLKLATESLRIAITWTLLLFIIKTVYKITTVLCDTLQLLCTADFAHLQIFLHPDIAKGPPNPSIIFLSLKLCFSCVSGLLTIMGQKYLLCVLPKKCGNVISACFYYEHKYRTELYFSVVGVNFCETMFHCAPFFGKMADFLGK